MKITHRTGAVACTLIALATIGPEIEARGAVQSRVLRTLTPEESAELRAQLGAADRPAAGAAVYAIMTGYEDFAKPESPTELQCWEYYVE